MQRKTRGQTKMRRQRCWLSCSLLMVHHCAAKTCFHSSTEIIIYRIMSSAMARLEGAMASMSASVSAIELSS